MESQPDLQGCVVHCAECEIRFLTHPRNAGRQNLRCPFGCRQHHRRQRSCQRSTAYYRTAAGRAKKKRLNARRQDGQVARAPPSSSAGDLQGMPPDSPAGPPPASASWPAPPELRPEEVVLDELSVAHSPLLPYVRMVVNAIEGLHLRRAEVLTWLVDLLRQHKMARRRSVDYVLQYLHQHPP